MRMNILMVASEMEPFARTGALGDVMLALPEELQKQGHQVSVALPFYRSIRESKKFRVKSTGVKFTIPVGNQRRSAEIFETRSVNGVQVLLIRRDEYFDRSGIYGSDGVDYQDNAERFIFFTKCVLELAMRLDPAPQVLHAHDWQSALLPLFIKAQQVPFASALTIHNPSYQGNFWSYDFALTNLGGEWFSTKGAEFYGSMNCLKAGILQADAVIVASEHYAHDLQTREYGYGLEDVFRENAWKLHGIPEGMEESEWNPKTDKSVSKFYDIINPEGKNACRATLLEKYDLSPSPSGPVIVFSSSKLYTEELDILFPILDRLLADDVRLILMGEEDARHEAALKTFLRRHRRKMAQEKKSERVATHVFLAGGDIALFPAHLEPSGEILRAALKYGAIPVARARGGLNAILQDCDEFAGRGNGFICYENNPEALLDTLRRARGVFAQRAAWSSLMKRAMQEDFSWKNSAESHVRVYEKILKFFPAAIR